MESQLIVHDTPQDLAQSAAELVVTAADMAIRNHGRFSISLSGGSTPELLFSLLGSQPYLSRIDWHKTDVFWGDERCVPPDHPDSDYRMAYNALLSKIPYAQSPRIYRLMGELDPQKSAESYEALLEGYFPSQPPASFDLLLLGLGDDGHTASLFPGTAAVHEKQHWVCAHFVPQLGVWRLTLTPILLNMAKQVIFLVVGEKKASVLQAVRQGPFQPDMYPAQTIAPLTGDLTWLVDRAAAGN